MFHDGANHISDEKSFRIKQDDGFFSRLMAKETSKANSSSRIFYYGEKPVSIPFNWEAEPGTPKHPSSETSLPPLTPPPSYYSKSIKQRNSKGNNIFSCILPIISSRNKSTHHVSPSSSSRSSSSSSSWSLVYPSSYTSSMRDKDHRSLSNFSRSTIVRYFLKHKVSKRFRGCSPFVNIKNGIVNHRKV